MSLLFEVLFTPDALIALGFVFLILFKTHRLPQDSSKSAVLQIQGGVLALFLWMLKGMLTIAAPPQVSFINASTEPLTLSYQNQDFEIPVDGERPLRVSPAETFSLQPCGPDCESRPGQLPIFSPLQMQAVLWTHEDGSLQIDYNIEDGKGERCSLSSARTQPVPEPEAPATEAEEEGDASPSKAKAKAKAKAKGS